MPLSLRVLSKWVTLFFLILESLGVIAALLKVALKIAYPHEVSGPALWAEPTLELTLRFAIVGLILSAYLRLRTTSQLPPVITRHFVLLPLLPLLPHETTLSNTKPLRAPARSVSLCLAVLQTMSSRLIERSPLTPTSFFSPSAPAAVLFRKAPAHLYTAPSLN